MKRLFTFLLFLCLLCTMILPAVAATVEYNGDHTRTSVTAATRSGSNFILPCENARERYVVKGHIMLLNYRMCQFGPSGQYAVFNVYRGNTTTSSNFIESYSSQFDGNKYKKLFLDLKTQNYSYGTYTIEYYVSWVNAGHYSPADSVRFRTTFEVVPSPIPVTSLGLINDDTDERYPAYSEISAAKGDQYTFVADFEPYNTTSQRYLEASSSDPSVAKFEVDVYGKLVLNVLKTGPATLYVECDDIKVSFSIIPRCDHDYQLVNRTAPTCDKAGEETYQCSLCEDSYTATVTPLGHNMVDGICSRCGFDIPFIDIHTTDWYYESVRFALNHGLFNGTSTTTFSPDRTMTRGMLVTVLHRFVGEPAEGESTFTDVPANAYYASAVAWAAKKGIVNGVGKNRFNPDGIITREQMATILFRFATKYGYNTDLRENFSAFSDGNAVSSYAKDALRWAVGMELINGSNGKLMPQSGATRAQVAAILMRFIENCRPI